MVERERHRERGVTVRERREGNREKDREHREETDRNDVSSQLV